LLFEAELLRQEDILAAVKEQGEAARHRNIGKLQEASASLTALLQQAGAAEKQRQTVVEHVAALCGMVREGLCLSRLLPFAPEPWHSQLSSVQERIQRTLSASRAAAISHHQFLRRGLCAADNALGHVTQQPPTLKAVAYTHRGNYGTRNASQAAFVDSRG
jgi:hypothetical protein